jgi:hypothetical protein
MPSTDFCSRDAFLLPFTLLPSTWTRPFLSGQGASLPEARTFLTISLFLFHSTLGQRQGRLLGPAGSAFDAFFFFFFFFFFLGFFGF